MADDRYRNEYDPRGSNDRDFDYGRDYGSGRDYTASSVRDDASAGWRGDRDDRNFRSGGTGYGGGNYGRETYGAGNRDYYGGRQSNFGQGSYGQSNYGQGGYGQGGYGQSRPTQGYGGDYRGSYASDGQRFSERDNDRNRGQGARGYGRQPEGYDYQDRGFMARAGDEVRSWFGDEDAERRREADQRYDERMGGYGASNYGRDNDYHNWRRTQIDALDRDYHEYRQENAKKFENEFGSWRNERQTQRTSLSSVNEHMEVVGSDGQHIGTVDKVRGDRIVLTKSDTDAGGRHHSIPSRWIRSVDDKVTISKSADEAKSHWRDEERSGAMFGNDRDRGDGEVNLNRSFSGTY